MTVAAFNKFYALTEDLAEGKHNWQSDTFKVMLTNSAPIATNAVKTDITDIAAGNGYAAGGNTTAMVTSAQALGVYKLVLTDTTFTAVGGSIATFRYAVLYNDTSATKPLIGWYDYAAALTLGVGESLTVDFDAAAGVLTIT
jgi:hypothetical protein